MGLIPGCRVRGDRRRPPSREPRPPGRLPRGRRYLPARLRAGKRLANGRRRQDRPIVQESAPLRRKLAATLRRLVETGRTSRRRAADREGSLRRPRGEPLRAARGRCASSITRGSSCRAAALGRGARPRRCREYLCRAGCARRPSSRVNSASAPTRLRSPTSRRLRPRSRGPTRTVRSPTSSMPSSPSIAPSARAGNDVALELIERLAVRTSLLRARSLADPRARKPRSPRSMRSSAALAARDGPRAGRLAERLVANAARAALAFTRPSDDPETINE